MKLRYQPANEEDISMIRTAILQNPGKAAGLYDGTVQYTEKTVQISAPHKVYQLSSKDIIYEKGLEGVSLRAQQYLLQLNEKVIGAAEIITADQKERSIKLSYGNDYRSMADAIELIEEHQLTGEYEFSVLGIPAIYVSSIWLRSKGKSYFVPFGNVPKEYDACKLYNEEEFMRPAKRLSLINIHLA